MGTIVEDFKQNIAEVTQAHAYWEGFKELYAEKIQWNLKKTRLYVEATLDLAGNEEAVHWKALQLTKAIFTVYTDLDKLTIWLPAHREIRKKGGVTYKKIWLVYQANRASYEHFCHKLAGHNNPELARLFGQYFARARRRYSYLRNRA